MIVAARLESARGAEAGPPPQPGPLKNVSASSRGRRRQAPSGRAARAPRSRARRPPSRRARARCARCGDGPAWHVSRQVAFACALVALFGWGATYPDPDDVVPHGTAAFARRFIHFGLFSGYGAGESTGAGISVNANLLEPGDILLGHNQKCVYGHWSHVTIYLGDGEILGHDIVSGIFRASLASFDYYSQVRIVRPPGKRAMRAAAAQRAATTIGEIFYLPVERDDPSAWTCAKCIYAAYREHHIDLSNGERLIRPDSIAAATVGMDTVLDTLR